MDKNKFRTEVESGKFPEKIGYQTSCMFVGSCFTHHIGERMQELKFRVDLNPFGMVYNPFSVLSSLRILQNHTLFTEKNLHYYNNRWFSFFHYTGFSHPDKNICLQRINDRLRDSTLFFQNANFLFLTLGTAWVYEWKPTGEVVSNCHKLPADNFSRRLLSVEEITDTYIPFLKSLFDKDTGKKLVFTVSPVRHWKDGAVENQRSKSILLLAVHRLVEQFEKVSYFPAYELMMDDLRDYRFYAEDMLHIGHAGANYIWERFQKALIDKDSLSLMQEVDKIIRAVNHRPFDPESKEHKAFRRKIVEQIRELKKKYPFLDFSNETLILK